jgi:hypothetical protein
LALSIFNDVILRHAVSARVPVLDLRLLCSQPQHYSPLSPIEPSSSGGKQIAHTLASFMKTHDFCKAECVVFW